MLTLGHLENITGDDEVRAEGAGSALRTCVLAVLPTSFNAKKARGSTFWQGLQWQMALVPVSTDEYTVISTLSTPNSDNLLAMISNSCGESI